jgi:hypothetical protein
MEETEKNKNKKTAGRQERHELPFPLSSAQRHSQEASGQSTVDPVTVRTESPYKCSHLTVFVQLQAATSQYEVIPCNVNGRINPSATFL